MENKKVKILFSDLLGIDPAIFKLEGKLFELFIFFFFFTFPISFRAPPEEVWEIL